MKPGVCRSASSASMRRDAQQIAEATTDEAGWRIGAAQLASAGGDGDLFGHASRRGAGHGARWSPTPRARRARARNPTRQKRSAPRRWTRAGNSMENRPRASLVATTAPSARSRCTVATTGAPSGSSTWPLTRRGAGSCNRIVAAISNTYIRGSPQTRSNVVALRYPDPVRARRSDSRRTQPRANADAVAAGRALRPHGKTHKSPKIARQQIAAGAVGVCCAKLGEAEVFAAAGIADIRLPYPVHPSNAARVVGAPRQGHDLDHRRPSAHRARVVGGDDARLHARCPCS